MIAIRRIGHRYFIRIGRIFSGCKFVAVRRMLQGHIRIIAALQRFFFYLALQEKGKERLATLLLLHIKSI